MRIGAKKKQGFVARFARIFELAVVAHTASKPVSKRHLMRNTTEIGLDRWHSLYQVACRRTSKA
jgi:hypothetical protein